MPRQVGRTSYERHAPRVRASHDGFRTRQPGQEPFEREGSGDSFYMGGPLTTVEINEAAIGPVILQYFSQYGSRTFPFFMGGA